ncbi:MAG: hypothetical protein B6242_10380 [Anaerolineaceae bacterium 4572_78]|nr:MAG: hypothetical protein B6242_10380 [Anaerolineaceae bacterium 4572_78]
MLPLKTAMPNKTIIPDDLSRTIVAVHQDKGVQWLKDFPYILNECIQRWNIDRIAPFLNLSFNYVAKATRTNGERVVIKIGVPCDELITEISALGIYDGRGSVRILDADKHKGVLLLELVQPATRLSYLKDDRQATTIAANVMRKLWRPLPTHHPFPHVSKWATGLKKLRLHFDGTTGPLPSKLVEMAEVLFAELLDSMEDVVLLHGDLHHENILASNREGWLAIDPKGVVGEPAYEVGALLRNPIPILLSLPNPKKFFARRIDQLCDELELPRQRVLGWGIAQSVLAAWWCIEDNSYGRDCFITCADIMADMI